MEMLKEHNATNNARQPMRISLLERSLVSSTIEEIIPDINESSWDKGNKKVVEVPNFKNVDDQCINEPPAQATRPNIFARFGGRVT